MERQLKKTKDVLVKRRYMFSNIQVRLTAAWLLRWYACLKVISAEKVDQNPSSQDWALVGLYDEAAKTFIPLNSPTLYDYGTW